MKTTIDQNAPLCAWRGFPVGSLFQTLGRKGEPFIPMTHEHASIEKLRELLSYDKETGSVTWIKSPSYKIKAGTLTGQSLREGYLKIKLFGKLYMAHRLIWALVTGKWPKNMIDHINGNGGDNRWINLREATHAENRRNSIKKVKATSKYKGVYLMKRIAHREKPWKADIKIHGKKVFLGYFQTEKLAHNAYCEAAKIMYGDFFNDGTGK